MDITSCFELFISFFASFLSLLIRIRFTMFGYTIDLLSIVIMCILISAIINILWRGAKS